MLARRQNSPASLGLAWLRFASLYTGSAKSTFSISTAALRTITLSIDSDSRLVDLVKDDLKRL
eukprot:scaffold6902_cov124-Pinguiococcus_pyrenoidosus.AAC.1